MKYDIINVDTIFHFLKFVNGNGITYERVSSQHYNSIVFFLFLMVPEPKLIKFETINLHLSPLKINNTLITPICLDRGGHETIKPIFTKLYDFNNNYLRLSFKSKNLSVENSLLP